MVIRASLGGSARVLVAVTALGVVSAGGFSAGCRTERREQILAGARRCFAEHGYEGATVVRLEQAIGLSRGAIFNYFGSTVDLFLELSYRDNARLVRLWMEKGWAVTLREIATEDPAWLGVFLEIYRKLRTDPDFRKLHAARSQDELAPPLVGHVLAEQERGELRHDQPAERVAGFISLVANGLAVQIRLARRSATSMRSSSSFEPQSRHRALS